MGRLLKPRGLKGEFWMTVFNVEDSALKIGIEVWLACENGNFSCQVIESIMISKSKSWIKFKGCHKREDVEEFIGLEFSIPRSKFAPLNENDLSLNASKGRGSVMTDSFM